MKNKFGLDKRKDKLKKIFTIYIIIFPALTVYASPIPSISFGEVVLFFLVIMMGVDMLRKRKGIKTNPLWGYVVYGAGISLISGCILSMISANYLFMDMLQRVLRDGVYFVVVLVFGSWYFDFNYGKKVIRCVSVVLGLFLVLQVVVYAMAQVYIPGIIPMLKTTASGGVTGAELIHKFALTASYDGYARASGFFSEPAVVAHFMTIALLLELFPEKSKVNYKYAFFFTATMLLTFSVNAYVAIVACWTLWALFNNRYSKNYVFKIALFMIAFCIVAIIAVNNSAIASVLNRLIELKNGERTSGSSVIRVLRGMAFYIKMPLGYQIFGSGFGNFLQFKDIYSITTIYETADEYMNTNAYILISSGVVGFALFIGSLLKRVNGRVVVSKMIFILVLVFGLSSSIYSTSQFVIMLLFMMYAPEKREIYERKDNYIA